MRFGIMGFFGVTHFMLGILLVVPVPVVATEVLSLWNCTLALLFGEVCLLAGIFAIAAVLGAISRLAASMGDGDPRAKALNGGE
jgi:hypothetical protein